MEEVTKAILDCALKPDGDDIRMLKEIVGGKVNGIEESEEFWEAVEMAVDSGASATVIGSEVRGEK